MSENKLQWGGCKLFESEDDTVMTLVHQTEPGGFFCCPFDSGVFLLVVDHFGNSGDTMVPLFSLAVLPGELVVVVEILVTLWCFWW